MTLDFGAQKSYSVTLDPQHSMRKIDAYSVFVYGNLAGHVAARPCIVHGGWQMLNLLTVLDTIDNTIHLKRLGDSFGISAILCALSLSLPCSGCFQLVVVGLPSCPSYGQ